MEHTVYVVLAVAGGVSLLLQLVLQVLGLSGGEDASAHHDVDASDGGHGNWFFGVLSLKALSAFAGIFGLTGLALEGRDMAVGLRVLIAAEAGIVAMVVVAFLMRGLSRLSASGTLDLRNAVGRSGSVYLRIPPSGQGSGKVTLEVQGRTVELEAVTDGAEIPTGVRVQVLGLVGEATLRVAPAR